MCRQHLIVMGNITSWEAIVAYKATRLAVYINRWRRRLPAGVRIDSIDCKGASGNFTRYVLSDPEQKWGIDTTLHNKLIADQSKTV